MWLVYAYFMITVIILTLAFFLQLFNASSDAAFTEWVYRSAERAMEPFRGIFPSATADNGSVIDFAVLFAIIVYGILAMLVQSLIDWIDRKIAEERAKAVGWPRASPSLRCRRGPGPTRRPAQLSRRPGGSTPTRWCPAASR